MSATFFIALMAALLAIMYWRVVLMIVGALLIAVVITGISSVSGALAGQQQPPAIVAPARPDLGEDGGASGPDATEGEARRDPGTQEQPPR